MLGVPKTGVRGLWATCSPWHTTAVCLIAVVLGGCASGPRHPVNLAELDAAQASNEAAAVHLYPGKSVSEVRKASERVLYLLDPNDMKFDVEGNELMATRWSTFYAVFVVGFGRDWYSVNFTQTNAGTVARFGFTSQMNTGMIASPISESFRSEIPISAHQNVADFTLFHHRVEYLLGLRDKWETCKAAKLAQTHQKRTMVLCDSIGLENDAPKGATTD